jgi:phage terminase small subunit
MPDSILFPSHLWIARFALLPQHILVFYNKKFDRNYSMFIKASKQLEDEGLTVTSDRGNIAPHPAIKIAKDAQTQAMKVMLEFGLTAKARTKLPKIEQDGYNPFEQFIKEGKETR